MEVAARARDRRYTRVIPAQMKMARTLGVRAIREQPQLVAEFGRNCSAREHRLQGIALLRLKEAG